MRQHVQYLPLAEIRDSANRVRLRFGDETLPVDVDLVAERSGLDLIPYAGLRQQVGLEAFLSGNLSEIVYEPDTPPVRLRFSFAHELGHRFLHEAVYSNLAGTTLDSWDRFVTTFPPGEWESAEWQANEFAGRLIVPREPLPY